MLYLSTKLTYSLLPPLLLAAVMAVGDVRTRRIPNYLTLGGALAGLLFQTIVSGWPGLLQGLGGLAVGFGLMLTLYIFGGMGAGDVKALGALGAWLTPWTSLSLFCYMAVAGGIVALGMLIWRGDLWQFLRRAWDFLVNLVLTRGREYCYLSRSRHHRPPRRPCPTGWPSPWAWRPW